MKKHMNQSASQSGKHDAESISKDEALSRAKATIMEQQALLEELTSPPHNIGHIRSIVRDDVKIQIGNDLLQISKPTIDLLPGDEVILAKTGAIVKKSDHPRIGYAASVIRIINKNSVEVQVQGSSHVVYRPDNLEVEDGDEVLVDHSRSNILEKIVDFGIKNPPLSVDVEWNDIGGLENAKQDLKEAIEWPVLHADLYKAYNKRPIKGIELFGPPGCGKTMLGKALATSIKREAGAKDNGFLYVKGPEILDQYVGVAEGKIRSLFSSARKYKLKNLVPAIIFIDEADAILSKRGSGISADMEKTIVPSFLAEMDGLDDFAAIVILATNRADVLDPAVVRAGRIDRRICINRPTPEAAADIFKLYLEKTIIAKKHNIESMLKHAVTSFFGAPLVRLTTASGNTIEYTLGHLASGATIANIVDLTVSDAIKSDIKAGKKTATGITPSNIDEAIRSVLRSLNDEDLQTELKEFKKSLPEKVSGTERVQYK